MRFISTMSGNWIVSGANGYRVERLANEYRVTHFGSLLGNAPSLLHAMDTINENERRIADQHDFEQWGPSA